MREKAGIYAQKLSPMCGIPPRHPRVVRDPFHQGPSTLGSSEATNSEPSAQEDNRNICTIVCD